MGRSLYFFKCLNKKFILETWSFPANQRATEEFQVFGVFVVDPIDACIPLTDRKRSAFPGNRLFSFLLDPVLRKMFTRQVPKSNYGVMGHSRLLIIVGRRVIPSLRVLDQNGFASVATGIVRSSNGSISFASVLNIRLKLFQLPRGTVEDVRVDVARSYPLSARGPTKILLLIVSADLWPTIGKRVISRSHTFSSIAQVQWQILFSQIFPSNGHDNKAKATNKPSWLQQKITIIYKALIIQIQRTHLEIASIKIY